MTMKNAGMVPLRKKSMSHTVVDLRVDLRVDLTSPPSTTVCPPEPIICGDHESPSCAPSSAENKMPDSPRQPTMSLQSEAVTESVTESASDLTAKDNKSGGRARRSSATMRSFLQRVMRSQSDSHIRIAPFSHNDSAMTSITTAHVHAAKAEETHESDGDEDDVEEDSTTNTSLTATSGEQCHHEDAETADLCDVFLNSSLQLLQVQSDAKQRVRQLWTCAQRLRWENQLSDSGLESLHLELLAVMKALTVEKLDGPRHIKAGYLTLVQAPPAVVAANLMQRGVAAATKTLLLGVGGLKMSLDQPVWVSLSEEQCRMEVVPYERPVPVVPTQPPSSQPQPQGVGDTFSGIGKFKLPTSISWLLSDPLQSHAKDEDTAWIGRTAVKLQGCQVRRMPAPAAGAGAVLDPPRVRFQVLVPNNDPCQSAPALSTTSPAIVPDQTSTGTHGVYVFEVPLVDAASMTMAEQERDEWIRAIDRVCVFPLYALENQLREACFMLQFRDVLAANFPVTVPLTWLRNRLEKMPHAAATGAMSAQQHATYQYQQLQRRSSRNLSMVQIVKDLERDRIVVDHKLLISCTGSSKDQSALKVSSKDASIVEHDSVAEIVQYLVGKVMAFARTSASHSKSGPHYHSVSTSSSGRSSPVSNSTQGPTSPSSRLAKFTEARALTFVERVLRGSSRTQSGGDIYDAISFFCQQRNLMICPMSHDAHPVQLNVMEQTDDNDTAFHIEIEVAMQFKVVELPAMTPRGSDTDSDRSDAMLMAAPRDWAVLEGTLRRQFTLGKVSEPGSVTVRYIPDLEACPHTN